MAQTEEIILKTTIDIGNSAASVKSVKQELRQLTNELATLDPASQKFRDVAQRAGELRDRIEDTNATIKAFNPEAKFQAFAGVLGGVANGFSAIQGAMTVFGDKNKDLEKIIARTQGAIAIATGVNGLLGMKDQFIILSNVIKTQVATSFNTLGKAIKSTGIIALVASLGVLIYEWYQEKKAAEDATAANKKAQEQMQAFSDKMKELQLENMRGRKKELESVKVNMNSQLHEIDKALKEEKYTVDQAEQLKTQIRLNAAKERGDLLRKFEKEDHEKRLEKQIKLGEDLIAIEKAKGIKTIEEIDKVYALELSMLDLQKRSKLISEQEYQAKFITLEKQTTEARQQLRIQDLQNQQMVANATMQGLSDLANAMGANAETMKAIAIAQTTIDTYYAAQTAFLQAQKNPISIIGPAYPYIMAGAAIASGLARVAAIARTNPKGSGGGNVPSGGGGAAPSAPMIAPASNATRLTNGNEPVITRSLDVKENKVYVLEKDITKAQGTVSNIRDQATVQ